VRRVISTNPDLYSPCRYDTRLLAITDSYSRVSDYNPCLFLSFFLRLALIRIFASLCKGICSTSVAHGIRAMMTCLSPLSYYKVSCNKYFIAKLNKVKGLANYRVSPLPHGIS